MISFPWAPIVYVIQENVLKEMHLTLYHCQENTGKLGKT